MSAETEEVLNSYSKTQTRVQLVSAETQDIGFCKQDVFVWDMSVQEGRAMHNEVTDSSTI